MASPSVSHIIQRIGRELPHYHEEVYRGPSGTAHTYEEKGKRGLTEEYETVHILLAIKGKWASIL